MEIPFWMLSHVAVDLQQLGYSWQRSESLFDHTIDFQYLLEIHILDQRAFLFFDK